MFYTLVAAPTQKNMEATTTPYTIKNYTQEFIQTAPYRESRNNAMGLRPNTVRNYMAFLNTWERYSELHQLDLDFMTLGPQQIAHFKQWLLVAQKYSHNHAGRLMGTLKTLCLDAQKNEIPTHPYVNFIAGFSQNQSKKIIHVLNFEEIKKVEQATLPSHLENVRKWMILGFWMGQRVSDLLQLKPEQVRQADAGGLYVDFHQQKTQKRITVGVLDPMAIAILQHDFPKRLPANKFNKDLKKVLQHAGISQMVKAYRFDGIRKRKELGLFPKHKIITAHDLRRSFATNFFGKIPTPLLMRMTGHARETTFMRYIAVDPQKDTYAAQFIAQVRQLNL